MPFLVQITRGLLRDQHSRRNVMFLIVVVALLMLFLGLTFLNGWLVQSPKIFVAYWAVCLWLTFTAVLLALYDLSAVRLQAREERRRLQKEICENQSPRD